MTPRTGNHRPAVSGELRTPLRPSHHPVQPDPDEPSVELEVSAFSQEDTSRERPTAIARDRQRAATAPGEPPVSELARQKYRASVDQIKTQALSAAQLEALRRDSVRPELDRTKPRGRR